jgi:hypothetical protein
VTNPLAYYVTELITAVESLIVAKKSPFQHTYFKGRLLALSAAFRLWGNECTVTNALAYYPTELVKVLKILMVPKGSPSGLLL